MPGGIGPVSRTTILACACRDRQIAPVENANEIFFNLDSRRVFYDRSECLLYFVDTPQGPVAATIDAALGGLNSAAVMEQMHLDPHRLFNGACCVRLANEHAEVVLVALRLAGIRATIRPAD